MNSFEKTNAVISELLGREVEADEATRLREDLSLDSANLIELTVLIHSKYGVDIGRKAVENKITPETVADLAGLIAEQ